MPNNAAVTPVDGIPNFTPSAWTALVSIFRPSRFRLKPYKGPFSIDDLATFAARCEVLKALRQKYFDAGYVAIQLPLFLSSTAIPSLTLSGDWYSPFTTMPDKLLWFKVWLDFSYLCGMFLYFSLLVAWRLARGTIPRFKAEDFAELAAELKNKTFGLEQHRDLLFFIGALINILTMCWLLHWILGLTFQFQAEPAAAPRLLSGSEFAYFFLTTFTTGGLGDIFPATTGSRLLTLFINFLTLVAIIYWFNLMARGRRPSALQRTLSAYFDEHKTRLTELADTAERAKIKDPKPNSTVAGLVFCPAGHRRPKDAKVSCLCCRGLGLVMPEIAVAYATWPPMKWRQFFMAINHLTPKQYRELLKK